MDVLLKAGIREPGSPPDKMCHDAAIPQEWMPSPATVRFLFDYTHERIANGYPRCSICRTGRMPLFHHKRSLLS